MTQAVVLVGRPGGTTHREVELLASLPQELRLIGGLAVMCRVGSPHRATVDLDAVARDLDVHHVELARLALTASGGGQYRFAGDLDLDVIEVAPVSATALLEQLTAGAGTLDGRGALSDLELNVLAHTWAHDTATPMDVTAVADADAGGAVLARAPGRLVASTGGLVAMKATTVPLRASSRPEKRASDLYDLGRLLVAARLPAAAVDTMPAPLRQAIAERLRRWYVEPAGRDRTFRDVRRFDEPALDLDDVGDAVADRFGP